MICLRQSLLIKRKTDGKMILIKPVILDKWKDDSVFTFNINDPLQWKKFLEEYESDTGHQLPMRDDTNEYRYDVYRIGGMDKEGNSLYKSYFPGYAKDGSKLDFHKYGVLE